MKIRLYSMCLLSFMACSGAIQAEPVSRFGASYYYIEGGSALVLIAQMDKKGPVGVDGRNHPARTKWDVQWRYRHNMHGGVCKMEKVSVMIGMTTVRPRWREEAQGPASLKKRWAQLIEAVDRNESYHKQQALEAGRQIEQMLNALTPEKTCDALTETANSAATDILGSHQSESRDYDLRTDYGRKTGVSLI